MKPNDCKTRWTAKLANGVDVHCVFDHNTGRFDMAPNDFIGGVEADAAIWRETREICDDLEGNYFYLRDVQTMFRNAGIETDSMPSY